MESSCCSELRNQQVEASKYINDQLSQYGLFGNPKRDIHSQQNATWRISPEPFWISQGTFDQIEALGDQLLRFYQGIQRLYEWSLRGKQPQWISEYLELGKPELVVDYGKMRRFRQDFPLIIRPDIILTDDGISITELDSVPGGFGLVSALSKLYGNLGFSLIGGSTGIPQALIRGFKSVTGMESPVVAIVVSEESSDYWDEMVWISQSLGELGLECYTLRPEDLVFEESGLYLEADQKKVKIDLIYRFFELFDLKNIPKIDLLLYAIRKQLVKVTPPLKHYLEEKMLFALLHHPGVAPFWQEFLGKEVFANLRQVIPESWVMDARPMPPHGVIPGLYHQGRAVGDWNELKDATKKERELVVKISGFSEQAWGSRGVHIGHDMANNEWQSVVDNAVSSFDHRPYVLQRFHKGRKVKTSYYEFNSNSIKGMSGRVRLCPYYIFTGDKVELSGILATICPLDKKLIHGMVDAVMVPTAIST